MEQRIETYTERVEEQGKMRAIRNAVSEADTMVFLGFSYLPENVKILGSRGFKTERIFGTALGISDSDPEVVKMEVQKLIGHNLSKTKNESSFQVTIEEPIFLQNDLRCVGLLTNYSRSLFAGGPT